MGEGTRPLANMMTRGALSIPIIGSSLMLAKHMWDKPSSTVYVKTDQGNIVPARAFEQEQSFNI